MNYRLAKLPIEPDWLKELLVVEKTLADNGLEPLELDVREPFYYEVFFETVYKIDGDFELEDVDDSGNEMYLHLFREKLSLYISLAHRYGKRVHVRQKENYWFKRLSDEIKDAFGERLYNDYNCTWCCNIRNSRKYPIEFIFGFNSEFYEFADALGFIVCIYRFLNSGIEQLKRLTAEVKLVNPPETQRKAA